MKILVADDDPVSRRVLREILIAEPGNQITEAADGEEAWAMLDNPSRYFDVVFLDVMMPKSDGLQLLARVRSSPIIRALRVVMCTSASDKTTVSKAISLGVRHFLVKPAGAALVQAKLAQIQAEIAAESTSRQRIAVG